MTGESAFNRLFAEPEQFDDGTFALSAELYPTRIEAYIAFKEDDMVDDSFYPDHFPRSDELQIHRDTVKYCGGYTDYGDWMNGWWLGLRGKGCKPVWTL
jgi:hypothetical protein